MQKINLLSLVVLITGCASMPPASELVLMAEANPDNNKGAYQGSALTCLKDQGTQADSKEHFEKLIDEALKGQTGLDEAERREALELLTSGKFKSDLQDIVILTLSITPKTLGTVPESAQALDELPADLHMCLTRQCANPEMLINTANRIYSDPSIQLQRQTFVALLDNRTFRLALIVYAHSNGIDIDNADLDFVQSQLQKDQIDMTALVDKGIERLKEKYKIDEAEARLQSLKSKDNRIYPAISSPR